MASFILLICFLSGVTSVSSQTEIREFGSDCGNILIVDKALVINLDENLASGLSDNCEITFNTQEFYHYASNKGFKFTFIDLDLPCDVGSVNFFFYNDHELEYSNAECNERIPWLEYKSEYVSSNVYKVDSNNFYGYFRFIITNTYYGTCDENTQFRCANDGCIDISLVNDGYDNCGDGSDENDGVPTHEQYFSSASTTYPHFKLFITAPFCVLLLFFHMIIIQP